jgi:ADP-L-glycero-D-manno-heptose 6-epimerase
MKTFVTGGTGFIGSNLVLRLLRDGHEVSMTGFDGEQILPDFHGKILYPSFLGIDWDALAPVDVVFHQAAINNTILMDRTEIFRANLDAPQELFRRAVEAGCRRIVYASSCAAYGDVPAPFREDGPLRPLNPYGESKKALDEFALAFAREHPDVTVVGLRYPNVYGPRENHKGPRASMIWQLAQQMVRRNPRLFKHGEQKRDYVFVHDVVEANLLAAQAKHSCIVNCGSGVATSFNDLVGTLNDVLGTSRTAEYIDNPYAAAYQNFTQCDMTYAKEAIGFVPRTDIGSGIRQYAKSGFLVSP